MNNLICGNQQPDKVAASVEEIVRRDVAAAGPIVYRIAGGDAAPASLASVLTDIGNVLGSGSTTPLLTVEMDLPGPRPASLSARMLRQGVGCYCGTLLFTLTLGRPIGGEVTIEDHMSFGSPKFLGGEAAGRLNAAKDLAKRVDKVLRTEVEMGMGRRRMPARSSRLPVRSRPLSEFGQAHARHLNRPSTERSTVGGSVDPQPPATGPAAGTRSRNRPSRPG